MSSEQVVLEGKGSTKLKQVVDVKINNNKFTTKIKM